MHYTSFRARLQREIESNGVASESNARLDGAIEEQVESAIEMYGNAPRDVYYAIQDPAGAKGDISMALSETTLDALVKALNQLALASPIWSDRSFPHKLLSINPKAGLQHDVFIPRFKSECIGRMVIEHVGVMQVQQAQQLFRVYQLVPQSSTLAGWIFEGLVHALLSDVDANSSIERKLFPMAHDNENSNELHYYLRSTDPVPFSLPDRKFTAVDLPGGKFNWP